MDRDRLLYGLSSEKLFQQLVDLHKQLAGAFKEQFDRSIPFPDELFDRWERAKKLGFGEESSIYDSSYVFGNVKVGKKVWIGPFTIIDGSGGLSIGDNCTISSGVHIYTHDNLFQTLSGGRLPIERESVNIGPCTYIGPNSIIKRGITIGAQCVIGASTFVNKDIPDNSIAVDSPARIIGKTIVMNDRVEFCYFNQDR